ncbi:DUF2061 domain-containing protein [Parvibaculum sp.]|jgi:uncharacterized membrane protein|uniref:DUF2061 domain-containing protein n=1 Tax=Parvibaculum sp. TaxID=2024848 RepID=UPI000C435932|nr:DUF2061 domain-containing protein [Parvibaculum sp.]MAM93062.1 hypothetical protein [Parvibaculum sp.]HCX69060.1 hypothetical protein [Rhodobiaceae bacterium]|tara:strand:+ start:5021 stop:5293 length:273 start_codon:yes stop_codon:yes gene_type:complete
MRDLVKTMTYAALHFSVGFGVTYALTGEFAIAAGVALIEPAVNTVVFFFHEKAWAHYPAAAFDNALERLGFHGHGQARGHHHGGHPAQAA